MIELLKLHHVSLAIRDLEASKLFYGGILGLPEIERPGFRFPGAWYALGDRQMHLIQESSGARERGAPQRSNHGARVADVTPSGRRSARVSSSTMAESAWGWINFSLPGSDGHGIEFASYSESRKLSGRKTVL